MTVAAAQPHRGIFQETRENANRRTVHNTACVFLVDTLHDTGCQDKAKAQTCDVLARSIAALDGWNVFESLIEQLFANDRASPLRIGAAVEGLTCVIA